MRVRVLCGWCGCVCCWRVYAACCVMMFGVDGVGWLGWVWVVLDRYDVIDVRVAVWIGLFVVECVVCCCLL